MKFFKYLIFLFFSLFFTYSNAATVTKYYAAEYESNKESHLHATKEEACLSSSTAQHYPILLNIIENSCTLYNSKSDSTAIVHIRSMQAPEVICLPYGYPAHFVGLTDGGIAVKRCVKQVDGSFCSYSDHGKKPFLVTIPGTDSPGRNLYSDGPDPVSSCYESDNGACNPKDPYGGCFKPADDGCTRQFDGSIVCPDEAEPDIQEGCKNNADYCTRPPQGCGEGYVSGTFNGERICVKSKPSNGSGDGSGSGDGVDLSETNGLLGEIRDGINDIKEVFSGDGKDELDQIGQPSNDPRFSNAESNAQSSLNSLANKLTFGSSACLSDFQIQLPIFGSVNIALSQWCSLLALIKILFQLVVLLTCLRMLDATVRTI